MRGEKVAKLELKVSKVAGEFPYGSPRPNEVAIASGITRVLSGYRAAIEAGQTLPPYDATYEILEETKDIAEARFARAILGSMRNTPPPIEGRSADIALVDIEATGAANGLAEAQQIHDARMRDVDRYSQRAAFGVQHEEVLEAALVFAAAQAQAEWQVREAEEIAAARGYSDVQAMVLAATPDMPAIIEEYAGASRG